jgi:hypothetical protein
MTDRLRTISIDDAIAGAEDAQRRRYERPSPYVVPTTTDDDEPADLLDWPCDYAGCRLEFDTLRELRTHVLDDHVLRLASR